MSVFMQISRKIPKQVQNKNYKTNEQCYSHVKHMQCHALGLGSSGVGPSVLRFDPFVLWWHTKLDVSLEAKA